MLRQQIQYILMSDSESSQEIEAKTEQLMEAELKNLLQKGKTITPFYDEETLLRIYKDCFQAEKVFLNKLHMIAASHQETQDNEDQQWIHFKAHRRQQKQVNAQTNKPPRTRFNFLEDKALLERAKNFNPEQIIENSYRQRKRREQRKEEPRERPYNKNKMQYREKQQQKEPVATNQEKKAKYRVKDSPNQKEEQKAQKPKPKFQEKIEKKETNNTKQIKQLKKQINTPTEQQQEKPAEAKKQPNPQPEATQQKSEKTKRQQKAYKLKEEPKIVELPENNKNKEVEKVKQECQQKIESQKSISSPTKPTRVEDLDPKVAAEFQESLKKNSMVLKFVLPSKGVQRVTYIKQLNGTYREVKVREFLSKK